MRYHNLIKQSAKHIFLTTTSFESNINSTSQLGYIIIVTGKHGTSNILRYQSTNFCKVTGTALAAELFAMTTAFDTVSTF